MEDNRKISIVIPTFNRFELLFKSFETVYDDDRVKEIVIVDDNSDYGIFELVYIRSLTMPKIKLIRNEKNLDCYANKKEAVFHSQTDWVILLDSDNVISRDYLDALFKIKEWDDTTIYTPEFAAPLFNFKLYAGLLLTKENVSEWVDMPMLSTMLNAANYFVNRDNYLRVWDGSIDPVTSDSIYMVLNWLKSGYKIYVTEELQYYHRVDNHDGEAASHYQTNVRRTKEGFHDTIINTLRSLK